MRIHHWGLEVFDIFNMERFYRSVLGFHLAYRYESRNTPGLRTVLLHIDQVYVELLASGRTERAPCPWGHVSIECPSVDRAWDAAIAKARSADYPTTGWRPPRETGDGFREAVLIDPEGNIIELGQQVRMQKRPPIQAVIFDFDGTLADSEPNYFRTAQKLLAQYGVDFTETDNERYIGKGNQEMLSDLVKRYELPVSVAELGRQKDAIYLELALIDTPVFPDMRRFLDLVRQAGLPVAVASGSSRTVLDGVLDKIGLQTCFPVVVSSEEVPRGKPAPDVFLEAARRLGVSAQACLVVEDSRPGVEAALRAFMPCLAVPSMPALPLDPTFRLADYLAEDGMSGFDPNDAFDWLSRFVRD